MSEDALTADAFDGIVVTHERVACDLHGAPFRDRWPTGWPTFAITAIKVMLDSAEVMEEARRLGGIAPEVRIDPKIIERVLDVRPACCRMLRYRLIELYEACGVGVRKRCKVCGRKALGTPITAVNASWTHMCFSCISNATGSDPSKH